MTFEQLGSADKAFCNELLSIATDSLDSNGQFTPFVAESTRGEVSLIRIVNEDPDAAYEASMKAILDMEPSPEMAAATFVDIVNVNDADYKAIIIQLYLKEQMQAWRFAHLFKIENNTLYLLHEFIFLEELPNILNYTS